MPGGVSVLCLAQGCFKIVEFHIIETFISEMAVSIIQIQNYSKDLIAKVLLALQPKSILNQIYSNEEIIYVQTWVFFEKYFDHFKKGGAC